MIQLQLVWKYVVILPIYLVIISLICGVLLHLQEQVDVGGENGM